MTGILTNVAKSLLSNKLNILDLAKSAPYRYKQYSIPKRSGGVRYIAQPTKAIKICQREVIQNLQEFLEPHPSAYAYVKKRGIKDNAYQHAKNSYILKLDLENFFNSITPNIFFAQCKKRDIVFSDEDEAFLNKILFFHSDFQGNLCLSIGAPSSPFVSNAVMFKFDEFMAEYSQKNDVTYTRYADDLTFSTNKRGLLFSFPEKVNSVLENLYNGALKLREDKTVFSSKAHNRHITGITITNQGTISLGRARKRAISSMVHNFLCSKLNIEESEKLKGLLSFASHVEPEFIERLRNKYSKYSNDLLLKIFDN